MNIQDLAKQYISVREKRLELEKQADEIKNGEEAELKSRILIEMQSSGIKSANVEGVGKVVSKVTSVYEIQDVEKFAQAMFKSMLEAAKSGRPFSDGMMLQKRVHRENLETILENSGGKFEDYGILQVSRNDLSVTRNK